ncbi:protein seele [Chironomus tepperi]|uniref:protein seele n=1 Tax=Chironomus tepperi TaxID=113505 RepID=UPI00391FB368
MKGHKSLFLILFIAKLALAQYDGTENLFLGNVDGKIVKCLVCEHTVNEVKDAQAKVDPKKKAEVKSGRFNPDGTLSGTLIEFRKSEQYLTELFEGDDGICKTMDDYAKAKYKSDGRLVVLKMFVDGGMNPLMSEVDFVQDQDLNKSLKHYCLEVLDEFDEVFLEYFMAPKLVDDVAHQICTERTKLCSEKEVEEEEDLEADSYLLEKEL